MISSKSIFCFSRFRGLEWITQVSTAREIILQIKSIPEQYKNESIYNENRIIWLEYFKLGKKMQQHFLLLRQNLKPKKQYD